MGHSDKTTIKSEGYNGVRINTFCGIVRDFSTQASSKLWLRLHSKSCNTCKTQELQKVNTYTII